MGLLDSYLDDPQQAGLLNAAAQMLATSGPSTMPRSFGQVLASGVGGFQQGAAQALAHQAAQQNFDINNIKMRDAESDLKNQDMLREQRAKIQSAIMGLDAPGAAQQPPASAAPMGGSIMAGMGAPVPDWMPKAPQQAAPQAQAAPTNPNEAVAARLIQEAQVYAKFGDSDGAMKRLEAAAKLQPKYSTDFRTATGPDGQLHNYVLADNGTWKDTGLGVKPDMKQLTLGDRVVFADGNAMKDGKTYAMGQSPDSKASNALGWSRLNFDKAQAESSGTGPLTNDAIDLAADRYNYDGTLPPMGMGKEAAAGRSTIMNRAAERRAQGIVPGGQRAEQLANLGDAAAQSAAVRSFATGMDGQAVKAANTALNHLETIRQLAQAQKNGDVRAFNQLARNIGTQFGQTAPTNLNAALIMVAPEISKAVVGVHGTGHEREQAVQALNPNGSVDQIISGTGVMQELFGGRLTEARRTYERTTKKKDFDSMLSPAAQQVLSRASGHDAAVSVDAIPQAAKSMLKMKPALRAEFDAKYGDGAAAAVLGK